MPLKQETIFQSPNEAPSTEPSTAPPRATSALDVTRSFAAGHYHRLRATGLPPGTAPVSRLIAAGRRLLPVARFLARRSQPAPVATDPVEGPGENDDVPEPPRDRLQTLREFAAFFKRMWVYLKPYKTTFIFAELAGIGFAFFNMMIPLLLKVVLDHVSPGPVTQAGQTTGVLGSRFDHVINGQYGVLLICMCVPAIMILRGFFDFLNNYSMAWVSLKVLGDMRKLVFTHISSQSLDFFHQKHAGDLISHVTNDTRVGQAALSLVGSDLIKQPLTVVACVIALVRIDPKFTLISLVLFPLCLVPVIVYGRRIRKNGRREEEQAGQMTVILSETFAGIRVIKSFAREDYQVQQFDASNQEQFTNSIRVRKAMEIVSPMVEVIAALGVGLALFYVHYRGMALSNFLALTGGLFLLYNPIKQISRMHMQIQRCQAALSHFFALLEMQPTIVDAPDAAPLRECRGEIAFDDVSFQYTPQGAPALNRFDVQIEPGRYVALVGASGAGKSTVLSLLQRFYDPTSGNVRIDGRDLRAMTQRSIRERVGMVTQDTFLFHDTIYSNILYGRLDATKEDVFEAARQAYAHDFILSLPEGYATRVGDKGCRLSGGQQQRLAIARALLKDAPILLLDEATSALDSESELMIQTALETLVKGRTVIAIAHRLSTILKADHIIVMEAGRMVEFGTHTELYVRAGRYRRLYDLQFDHENHPHEAAG